MFKYIVAFASAVTPLTVHLVPHSHCDVGWQTTIDGYFYQNHKGGTSFTKTMAGVETILTEVVNALLDEPSRKFIWAEMFYFEKWWSLQSAKKKREVKYLVTENRQLEFVSGGWSANDEACPTYQDILMNHQIGQEFITREYGTQFLPKAAWYADSFGHSKTNQRLSKEMGMQSTFFGRLD